MGLPSKKKSQNYQGDALYKIPYVKMIILKVFLSCKGGTPRKHLEDFSSHGCLGASVFSGPLTYPLKVIER